MTLRRGHTESDLAQTLADFHENSRYWSRDAEAGLEAMNALRRWIRAWETDAEAAAEQGLRAAEARYAQIHAEGPPRPITR